MSTIPSAPVAFQLEPSTRKFRTIADFAPVMMWMSGSGTLFEWFNRCWRDFTGHLLEQDWEKGWAESVHPEDLDICRHIYHQAFDTRRAFSSEYRLKRFDGEYCWITDKAAPTFDEDGVFTGFVGSCQVIQEYKNLQAQLLQESGDLQALELQKNAILEKLETRTRLYETILSATPDFIYTFDFAEPEHRFTYANEGLVQLFGRPYDQIVGKTFRELGYEDWHAEMHDKEIDTVRLTKQSIRGEVAFTGTFGRRIYDYIFSPVFDSNGEVEAVAGTTRDVTERYNTQEILRKNKEALQEADLRKDEFLAMLAHELRNPLAPISAAAHIMTLSNYEESRVRTSVQIIERQVKHLVGLVDDLLDVSRVTRGLVNIEKLPQDMAGVIASSVEQVRPLIDFKQHQLIVALPTTPTYVIGDQKRLVQIVSNVLNNAAKYTEKGGQIKLAMAVEDNAVIINISDNGIGISPEDQTPIFELFAQAKRSSDRSQGGLGIGLALVKSMLKLHNGTISCHSEGIGKGSEFTISLPLWQEATSAQEFPGGDAPQQQKSLSILVVDDNVDAASTLGNLLSLYGHDLSIEHDALKALERIHQQLPDICILDIGLPNMDGYELAQRIKQNPLMDQTTLIAVTGYGQESDIKRALESGFDYHLVKPVDFDKLIDIIEDLADSPAG
jgi:PAS domain S-box-containing protein